MGGGADVGGSWLRWVSFFHLRGRAGPHTAESDGLPGLNWVVLSFCRLPQRFGVGVPVDIYGEFDSGSGRTLAACLTHASRTVMASLLV